MLQSNLLQEYDTYVPTTTQSNNYNYLGVKMIIPILVEKCGVEGGEMILGLTVGFFSSMNIMLVIFGTFKVFCCKTVCLDTY